MAAPDCVAGRSGYRREQHRDPRILPWAFALSARGTRCGRTTSHAAFSVSPVPRTLSGFAKGSAASTSIRRIAVAAVRGSHGARAKPDWGA